jgi:hypothetical protein
VELAELADQVAGELLAGAFHRPRGPFRAQDRRGSGRREIGPGAARHQIPQQRAELVDHAGPLSSQFGSPFLQQGEHCRGALGRHHGGVTLATAVETSPERSRRVPLQLPRHDPASLVHHDDHMRPVVHEGDDVIDQTSGA